METERQFWKEGESWRQSLLALVWAGDGRQQGEGEEEEESLENSGSSPTSS